MLTDIIKPENIAISHDKKNFDQVLSDLVDLMNAEKQEKENVKVFLKSQEKLISSALGKGVILFRVWPVEINNSQFTLEFFPDGCDIEVFDDETIKIAVLLAAPKNCEKIYHENLVSLLRLLNETSLRDDFLKCSEPDEIISLIKEEEEESEQSA